MRIRSVKPDYWKDARLHNTAGITADVREFYIGCWGLADDAGFMRWDVPAIGAELYAYRSAHRREANVAKWGGLLVDLGRLKILDCGHAFVPKLTAHQRMGGNRTTYIATEHAKCIHDDKVRTSPDEYGQVRKEGEVRGGEGREGEVQISDLPNITDPALRARLLERSRKAVGER